MEKNFKVVKLVVFLKEVYDKFVVNIDYYRVDDVKIVLYN